MILKSRRLKYLPRAVKSQGFRDHCNHKVYTKVYVWKLEVVSDGRWNIRIRYYTMYIKNNTEIGSRYNYQNTIYNAIVHITQLYNSTTCRKVQSINYMTYTIW